MNPYPSSFFPLSGKNNAEEKIFSQMKQLALELEELNQATDNFHNFEKNEEIFSKTSILLKNFKALKNNIPSYSTIKANITFLDAAIEQLENAVKAMARLESVHKELTDIKRGLYQEQFYAFTYRRFLMTALQAVA